MKIKKCRICKSTNLITIGSLGNIALSNFTKRPTGGVAGPLELMYCKNCTLFQLAHNPERRTLYENHYWYESSLNPTIVSDLQSVVTDALSVVEPKPGDMWLDIGANDGTLLSFVPKPFYKIGIDPATNLIPSLKQHADKTIRDFFDEVTISKKAKIITAIAVFYDLPDPNLFTQKLKQTLAKNGVAVIQLMTLSPMIENNDVGNICHEHIEYYSYKSLVTLFDQNGLEIFKVKTNTMNGGSYRLFIRHKKKGSIRFSEKKYTVAALKRFFVKVEKNKQDFLRFVKKCKTQKKKIIAYGASTKGNTILQYYGLDTKAVSAVVDINPEKEGRFLVASKIPIVSTIPDCDYLWILPYAFLDFFVTKEKKFREKGGKFVVCTPKFRIV
ncbi:MAG: methyltransferase domain-containing protein [Candidatus Levyibacteriota bacterium]